jgi:schlafen family protein
MAIYTKPISQISAADLQELVQENAVENARLEFKSQVPNKDETLKKLTSFANTFGGFVVIGAAANGADGRIQDLPGVDPQNSYKQTLVQWCFDAVSPPLSIEVSDAIPVPSGKVCYVIAVPESDVAPHYINGRKGAWVRTDEFSAPQRFDSKLANDDEIQHLQNRRRLVLERRDWLIERARKRFQTYIKRKHTDASGNKTKTGPIFELFVVPRFPTRPLCAQEALRDLIQSNCISWRNTLFPDITKNQFTVQNESVLVLDSAKTRTSIFEVNVWGLMFYGGELRTDFHQSEGIHPYDLAGGLLLYLLHATKILSAMGYSGNVLISASLDSILGVPLLQEIYGTFGVTSFAGSELDDDVTFSMEATAQELTEKSDGVTLELLRRIFFSMGWAGAVSSQQNAENLLRKAYAFNLWQLPEKLKL